MFNGCGDGWRYMSVTNEENPNPLEQCDDGDGQEHDTCTDACVWNDCGDGKAFTVPPTNECNPRATEDLDVEDCRPWIANLEDLSWYGCDDDIECACLRLSTNACDIDADHVAADVTAIGCDTAQEDEGLDDDNDGAVDDPTEASDCLDNAFPCRTDSELDDCYHPLAVQGDGDQSPFDGEVFFFDLEECDDGDLDGTNDCVVENEEFEFFGECQLAECGDGYVQEGEECDTGEGDCEFGELQPNGDVESTSEGQNTLYCRGRCNNDATPCEQDLCQLPYCGDGIVQPDWTVAPDDLLGETCDPEAEPWETEGGCGTDCVVDTCGNGELDDFEECDDEDDTNTDDCTNGCLLPRCGDGIVSPVGENLTDDGPDDNLDSDDEECDDGNDDPTDSCTNDCKWNVCGDGVRYLTVTNPDNENPTEECDSTWNRRVTDGAENTSSPDDGDDIDDGSIDGAYGNWDSGNDGWLTDDVNPIAMNGSFRNDDWTDGPGLCSAGCEIQCFPNQGFDDEIGDSLDTQGRIGAGNREWAGEWKDETACLFAAEPYGDDTPLVYHQVTLTWEQAQDYCEGYGVGADLAAVVNEGDEDANTIINDFGTQADRQERAPNPGDFLTRPDEWWWLGLRDIHTTQEDPPGEWVWWPDHGTVSNTNPNWAAEGEEGAPQRQPDDADDDAATPGQQDCGYIMADDGNDDPATIQPGNIPDPDPPSDDAFSMEQDLTLATEDDCTFNAGNNDDWDDDSCGEDGKWYDVSCTKILRFFCEFPLDQAP
jgi:hypothetical protein